MVNDTNCVNFFKVNELPAEPLPDSFYYVKTETGAKAYLTDYLGNVVNISADADIDIAQETGTSTTAVMSQDAVTNELDSKLDNSAIVQTTGASATSVMSQNAITAELNGKVDKIEGGYVPAEAGKGLSTNDYTDLDKTKLSTIEAQATKNQTDTYLLSRSNHTGVQPIDSVSGLQSELDSKADTTYTDTQLDTKVDKVAGKGLSDENYTLAEKNKLSSIQASATANATNAQLRDRTTHTGTQNISTIENLDLALYNSTSLAIVALSGGKLELIADDHGNVHLFGVIPIQTYEQLGIPNCPFTGIIDAFRKADGTYLSEKRIAIYKSVNVANRVVSQAGKMPYVNLSFDEFKTKANALGSGFRLLDIYDNALINWIILGIISRGGQAPRGNTEWGRAHDAIYEIGARGDGQVSNARAGSGATLTGSGPLSWNHDGTAFGISDWVGNVWEWIDGLKMSGGEFVVAEYSGQPESEWLRTGRYINAGHVFSMTAPPSPVASYARWGSLGKTSGYVGHELLQRLMIEPINCTKVLGGNFWYNTGGEHSPFVRGGWNNGSDAGSAALHLSYPRSRRNSSIGSRLAFGL